MATYACTLLDSNAVEVLDLNDYELPLFSEDKEQQIGQPELAQAFLQKIQNSDTVIISFAEHNGSYTAAYKNLFDWCSRINSKVYQDKTMILLATSPGPGGAGNILTSAINAMPHFGGLVKGHFSLPYFYNNFDMVTCKVTNPELEAQLQQVINQLNKPSDTIN
ncbi:MAG: chromate reductase, NAD(P)H dehydrogenase (quinone) [Thiomicrorhabdus sp.]|nr:MAG: chromate reductase, NAD(P)H dehydrogenase (quinone) [Thiomicrorhabdus sp.]